MLKAILVQYIEICGFDFMNFVTSDIDFVFASPEKVDLQGFGPRATICIHLYFIPQALEPQTVL